MEPIVQSLCDATITELAPRLACGEISAVDLVEQCLVRANEVEAALDLNALICINQDARDRARELDDQLAGSGTHGPLHGIPVVIKDNIDLKGIPTTSGCRALANAIPTGTAAIVATLEAAGAIIVAKTNLSEFSFEVRSRSSIAGDVRNPFCPAVTAGGSSGGSAAAIAAGYALAGLGTDTGGSIRIPASFNGLFGLRPTYGLLPMDGIAPLAPSADVVGPIARSLEDLATLFRIIAPVTSDRPRGAVARPRLGILRDACGADIDILARVARLIRCATSAGAIIVDPISLPLDILPINDGYIVDWEFGAAMDAYLQRSWKSPPPASLAAILSSGDYLKDNETPMRRRAAVSRIGTIERTEILQRHAELDRAVHEVMDRHALDALIFPTSATLPASLDNPAVGWGPELAARTGRPALSMPVGLSNSGIPIGMELLGHHERDWDLLRTAQGIGAALGPFRPTPPWLRARPSNTLRD